MEWELVEKNKLVLKGTEYRVSYTEAGKWKWERAGFVVFKGDKPTSMPKDNLDEAKQHAEWAREQDLLSQSPLVKAKRQADLRALGVLDG